MDENFRFLIKRMDSMESKFERRIDEFEDKLLKKIEPLIAFKQKIWGGVVVLTFITTIVIKTAFKLI